MKRNIVTFLTILAFFLSPLSYSFANADENLTKDEKRKKEMEELQKHFEWWPTDAKPGPVKDPKRGGYWWWPTQPGKARPWGNRGYVYVYKIIFDYKEEELPPPEPEELRPSLLIRKIVKNVKIYYDYNKEDLREDASEILTSAIGALRRNPEASILVTGNCDLRGSEAYNEKLGRRRAESVKTFMLNNGIPEEKIRIVSHGKLDAVAPITDLEGMQKDRNAHFIIAEVEEVMLPYPGEPKIADAKKIEEGKFLVEEKEKVESGLQVSTREYVIQKNDSLWKIAKRELGSGHRWKYLYEINKDRIKNPNRLIPGKKLIIPVE